MGRPPQAGMQAAENYRVRLNVAGRSGGGTARAASSRSAQSGAGGEGASLTTAEPPALRGLVLSQRDKTHHLVPATFNRTQNYQ